MTHKEKLIKSYVGSNPVISISFEDWLIEQSESNHRKLTQMSGDLGKAYSDIGDLYRKFMDTERKELIKKPPCGDCSKKTGPCRTVNCQFLNQ